MDVPDAECSHSCGTGFKRQFRSCINPVPECGGEACEGTDNRTVACNEHCCPSMLKCAFTYRYTVWLENFAVWWLFLVPLKLNPSSIGIALINHVP